MPKKEDLQQLLPPEHQDDLLVVPKSTFRMAICSIGILCLGVGMTVGASGILDRFGDWAIVLGLGVALIFGWRIQVIERSWLQDESLKMTKEDLLED